MTKDSVDLQTRRATESDCKALTDLCYRSKQSNGYDNAFMEACHDELTVTGATLAESECWIAHNDYILCGCACLTITDVTHDSATGDGEIGLFFVDPEYQHQGVGTLLWQTLLARARYHQLQQLMLDADPSAQGFYEYLGFKVIGQSASGSIPGRYLPRMCWTTSVRDH